MCKNCAFIFEENGDCWDSVKKVQLDKRQFGLTKIEQKTSIVVLRGTDPILPRGFYLNCEVSVGENIEDMIFDSYIPIRYCPFCGSELEIPFYVE